MTITDDFIFCISETKEFSQYFKARCRAVIFLLRLSLFICRKAACCNSRQGIFSPQKNSVIGYLYCGGFFAKHYKHKVSLEINLVELNNTSKITKRKRLKMHLVKVDKQ